MNSSYSNYPRNYYTFVNGLDGAKNYPIAPNQSLMLMDSEAPVCYMKTADLSGKPNLKCYKLVEIPETDLVKTPETEVIKNEISNINKRIDELVTLVKGDKQDA